MEPTFREKVGLFLRQISSGHEKKSPSTPCTSPTSTGSFIHRYLLGEVKREHPDIFYAKSCYELPIKEVGPLIKPVLAAYTGPTGGLTSIDSSQKPFESPDADVYFIDEDCQEDPESRSGSKQLTKPVTENEYIEANLKCEETKNGGDDDKVQKPKPNSPEIAGIKDWNCPRDAAYGIATTLYECHPISKQNAGEPIADAFAIVMRENSAILVLADGVNWGEKSCLAARCAVHGCVDYLNKALYREGRQNGTTLDIFIALLRSFQEAHNLIIQEQGNLTTLCAAVVAELRNSNKYVVCTCNVGDSLAYVYSPKYGVREITQGSHDIYSMRDMRDALGALGPVDGINPELSNLTVALTEVDYGDTVYLASDGITDNFDPVVGKFAIPRKVDKSARSHAATTINHTRTQDIIKHLNQQNHDRSSGDFVIDLNLPVVEAHQRHELTLLRMEDLIVNGVNEGDSPSRTARQLCEKMIDFAEKLTIAKRRILEDPDLYKNDDTEVNQAGQMLRRRKVGEKLAMVPGKLDHASIVAYNAGGLLPNRAPIITQCESLSDLKS